MDKFCLCCGKEIKQTEGKREKVYCDTTCRSNYWQKAKRLEEKKFSAEEIVTLLTPVKRDNEFKEVTKEDMAKSKTPPMLQEWAKQALESDKEPISEMQIADIKTQIKTWEGKKCPSYMGKVEFENMRVKEISELKKKINV